MATTPPAAGTNNIVTRAKNILMQPKAEWAVIDAEPATVASLYRNYILILAAIGPVAYAIGMSVFGVSFFGISYRPSIGSTLAYAIVMYGLSLVSVYVLSLIIDALAPSFGGTKKPVQALKVAAYSTTASWVAGIFYLLPTLSFLSILGLYSLYLLYLGLPVLMKTDPQRSGPYAGTVIVCAVVLYLVVGGLTGALVGGLVAPSVPQITVG